MSSSIKGLEEGDDATEDGSLVPAMSLVSTDNLEMAQASNFSSRRSASIDMTVEV